MPKAYTVAISAENNKTYYLASGMVLADNGSEAKGLGTDAAKRRWPPGGGWVNHACSADEIPAELMQSGADVAPEPVPHRAILGSNDVIGDVVERLSQTDPSNVQRVAAAQVGLLTIYHNLVLDQARRSFKWALIAAGAGFGFFLAAVGFILLQQSQNVATVSLISGALIEVISAINFYLYGKTSAQLAAFQTRLDQTQRYLLANSVCEGLEGDFKQRARAELVTVIASIRSDQISTLPANSGTDVKS